MLRYYPIQKLTIWQDIRMFDRKTAFCPMTMDFYQELMRIDTQTRVRNPPFLLTQELRKMLSDATETWLATDHCRQMMSIISSLTLPPVDKVNAFALCSMTFDSEPRWRSVYQHVFMLSLRKLLSPDGEELKCYAQDPIYTDHDKEALEAYGVVVPSDPRGFLEIDDRSVVLSIGPNVPVKEIVADIGRPAIIIWVALGDHDPTARWYDSDFRFMDRR